MSKTGARPTPEIPVAVLVVEDDVRLLPAVLRVLAFREIAAVGVGSAEEALERLRAGLRPRLLLTDIGLPGASGVDLAHVVGDEWPELRVLLMTAMGTAEMPGRTHTGWPQDSR